VIRLAADENFNNHVVRGLLLRKPGIDIICIQDVGLSGKDDPTILEWAAREKRILLAHDVETITYFAYNRVEAGLAMPGVFIMSQDIAISHIIEDLLLIIESNEADEWENRVFFLPLKNKA